jgi:hypothetical protein
MENKQMTVFEEVERQAVCVSKSGLFGMKTPEQALTMMLVAQAEGRRPIEGPMRYHIIDGKPSKKADAMLADFQTSGGKVEWLQYTDDCVEAVFSHPSSPRPVTIKWDNKTVEKAGVKNMHLKYPRAMKRARVISEGVRTCYPAATGLLYTPEEVQDFEPKAEYKIEVEKPARKPAKKEESYEVIPEPPTVSAPEIIEAELAHEEVIEPKPEPKPEPKVTLTPARKAEIANHIKKITMGQVEDEYIKERVEEAGEEAYTSAWSVFGEQWITKTVNGAMGALKLGTEQLTAALNFHGLKMVTEINNEAVCEALVETLTRISNEINKPKPEPKPGIKVPNMWM